MSDTHVNSCCKSHAQEYPTFQHKSSQHLPAIYSKVRHEHGMQKLPAHRVPWPKAVAHTYGWQAHWHEQTTDDAVRLISHGLLSSPGRPANVGLKFNLLT